MGAVLFAAADKGLVDGHDVETILGLSRKQTIAENVSSLSGQSKKSNTLLFSEILPYICVGPLTYDKYDKKLSRQNVATKHH